MSERARVWLGAVAGFLGDFLFYSVASASGVALFFLLLYVGEHV